MMRLESICCKVPTAIAARNHPFGASIDLMGFESISLNFLAAFVVTVHQFKATVVIFHDASGEVFFAVGTSDQPFRTSVEHVIFHQ